MKGLRPFVLLMALMASGCSVLDLQDNEREQYENNRKVWDRVGPDDYIAVMERRCFCGPEARGPVSVRVQRTTVLSRAYTDTGEDVPAEYASFFPTVDGIFDIIDDALDRGADEVEVYYDPLAGVPFNVWIDYDENTADDEIGFLVELPLTQPEGR